MTDRTSANSKPSSHGCNRSIVISTRDRCAASIAGTGFAAAATVKKAQLQLRDRIAFIEDQITPDIILRRWSPAR